MGKEKGGKEEEEKRGQRRRRGRGGDLLGPRRQWRPAMEGSGQVGPPFFFPLSFFCFFFIIYCASFPKPFFKSKDKKFESTRPSPRWVKWVLCNSFEHLGTPESPFSIWIGPQLDSGVAESDPTQASWIRIRRFFNLWCPNISFAVNLVKLILWPIHGTYV